MKIKYDTNANYVADREVVDVRNTLNKFYNSATVTEDDPNITIVISPYLAKFIIDKTKVGTKKIIKPILKEEDKLKIIFGKNVIIKEKKELL